MSIIRSMTTGASGLRAHSEALDVVGDNIANVNTVGFKRSRAIFEDLLGRAVTGGSVLLGDGAGSGSRVTNVQQIWTQGTLITTNVPTDLAISGDGTFIVNGTVEGITSNFYARAGQFTVDKDGFLVNPDGLRLQGYQADSTGTLAASLSDLRVSGTTLPASPTANVTLAANLDARSTPIVFDPLNPAATSNFSSNTTVYDSLGNAHDVTVYYVNTAAGAWDWHAMVDGGDVTGGTPGVPFQGANGTLTFDTTGALTADTTAASTWNFVGATPAQAIAFDFGVSTAEGGTGFAGSTQLAQDSNNMQATQDGFSGGDVAGIRVEATGIITGVFASGQQRTLGRVAIAHFESPDGLARVGKNVWAETTDSGTALVGGAGSGGRGSLVAGALEGSNVDIGQEFVDLISYQRGFSANSKIITTADEMYQELVNLKR